MRNGFSMPLVFIAVITSALLVVWIFSAPRSSSSENVRGSSTDYLENRVGLSVFINADSSTWDLVEYLCETLPECKESLTSGRRWATLSGGEVSMHEVVIEKSALWDGYSYLKLYVKPRWGSFGKGFKVESLGNVPNSNVYVVSHGNETYETVIIPLKEVSSAYYRSALFSDR